MHNTADRDRRKPRRKLSVRTGNVIQGAGVILGCLLLWFGTIPNNAFLRVVPMVAGYLLIYFSTHSLTHYVMGQFGAIKFTHYSIGGTSHPSTFPALIRPIFVNLPFFAVHADPESLRSAWPLPRALMFGSGILATALFSTLASLFAYRAQVPGSTGLLIFNAIWQVSSLIAEAGPHGDLGKAAKDLKKR